MFVFIKILTELLCLHGDQPCLSVVTLITLIHFSLEFVLKSNDLT